MRVETSVAIVTLCAALAVKLVAPPRSSAGSSHASGDRLHPYLPPAPLLGCFELSDRELDLAPVHHGGKHVFAPPAGADADATCVVASPYVASPPRLASAPEVPWPGHPFWKRARPRP